MSITTPDRRRAAGAVLTGLLGPNPTPGSDSFALRQQVGWGYSGLPLIAQAPYGLPVTQHRGAAAVLTGILHPSVNPGADMFAIRQQIGWGYSGLPVGAEGAPEPTVTLDRFVYRKFQRLRAKKRRFN